MDLITTSAKKEKKKKKKRICTFKFAVLKGINTKSMISCTLSVDYSMTRKNTQNLQNKMPTTSHY